MEARITRREFSARLALFLAATHGAGLVAAAEPEHVDEELPEPTKDDAALLRRLRLHTTTPLKTMREFYEGRLGFPVPAEGEDTITFRAGTTEITFVEAERGETGDPFYHVAFNIPENKHAASKAWLETSGVGVHKVAHFRHWNAHAVFFLDPAGNILEFIARHDLKNAASGGFDPAKDALCASEIAFIVKDDEEFSGRLRKALGLPRFRGGPSLGTDHGILLVFERGRKWYRPAETYPAVVTIAAGDEEAVHRTPGFLYEIRAVPRTPS